MMVKSALMADLLALEPITAAHTLGDDDKSLGCGFVDKK